ncbi:MAG TPA: gephyrin-like molybdotransferase Glp [Lacunisphaera sp.]|nr:gephyrin-like molybdotransferase Glp [Lacunisphaera sp.]
MELIAVPDALREVLARAPRLAPERVPLAAALDRVLTEPARADLDSPPFDASAMDGYALRRADLDASSATLRLVGESAAGAAFAGAIGPGECVRILTGAPVPAGADCVVKQEDTTRDGDQVRCAARPDSGAFIRRRGENRRAGEIIVAAGTGLGPPELAALASAGITQPPVTRRPRVAHVVTGNELVPPDHAPTGAQIRDSNSALIAALVARQRAELAGHVHVRDDLPAAEAAIGALPAHDVLLISGGAGAGDHDFARPVLRALGYTLRFQQVNLRPGKPLVFATRGEQLAFVLPGNPVSHWVTFALFVAPLLQQLATGRDCSPPRLLGRLAASSPLPSSDARQTIWPARATIVNGQYVLSLLPLASSGDSSSLVGANALVPLPAKGLDVTSPVEFIDCR